jgi:hypothetical protein
VICSVGLTLPRERFFFLIVFQKNQYPGILKERLMPVGSSACEYYIMGKKVSRRHPSYFVHKEEVIMCHED